MYLAEALQQALLDRDEPAVTDYELYRLGLTLVQDGHYGGVKIKRVPDGWDLRRLRAVQNRLIDRRVIASDQDFRSGVWRVVQATGSGSAEEAACIADPFCYVSHLSAMQRYGLTDRSPEAAHLTTPDRSVWNALRDAKVASEINTDVEYPPLLRVRFHERVRRRPIVLHETKHPATPLPIAGERARIASIGRTFADMLSEPRLSGGIHHVIEVWEDHAESWVEEIIAAIDDTYRKIVKVRAGYLLAEHLGMTDPRIQAWKRFAQRGGSQKLDPDTPYAPRFSEGWMLSLNV
jgi:predicted transcriptional regulator of viral defense system